jgi:hypothetical protein
MQTPVTFLVFNRPELTAQVFARIREARPPKLLIVCDGPRPNRPDDAEKVSAVRNLIDRGVDWPCEVMRNYADKNLGCRNRIASGLTWAFEQIEESIILEDDCLPDPSFFGFAETMLNRYRHDDRILHVSGNNLTAPHHRPPDSYWFSRHPWIWGWATWRRAWQQYDAEMSTWDARRSALEASFASSWERAFWIAAYEEARRDLTKAGTWDFPWVYTCRSLGGLCIFPRENLIENLGFGGDSTHTSTEMNRLRLPAQNLGPITHPQSQTVDRYADDLLTRIYAGSSVSLWGNLKARLRLWRDTRDNS